MEEVDDSVYRPLLEYLNSKKQPQSMIFGLSFIRSHPPDISKRSWTDPRMYYLVMKIALTCLPADFTYTTAQLIKGIGKLDNHNKGKSYIVRFGAFTEGELVLKTPNDTEHNIRHRPVIFDCSETEYYFKEAKGDPWTLVFYTITSKHPPVKSLKDYEAVFESGKWSIAMYRKGQQTVYLSKKSGLPLPLTKKKQEEKTSFAGAVKVKKPSGPVDDPRFTAVQNLMMRSALNTE
jgi:hypothetical protein